MRLVLASCCVMKKESSFILRIAEGYSKVICPTFRNFCSCFDTNKFFDAKNGEIILLLIGFSGIICILALKINITMVYFKRHIDTNLREWKDANLEKRPTLRELFPENLLY